MNKSQGRIQDFGKGGIRGTVTKSTKMRHIYGHECVVFPSF